MDNFWKVQSKPLFALAPMEDVTDTVFRELVMSVATPENLHILYTEFTSTDGLCHPRGREMVRHRLRVNPAEKELLKTLNVKLVAQIWGSDPEKFRTSAAYIAETGDFQGIDINMGCPVSKVVKKKSCSALILDPPLAKEIIQAVREGSHLPLSVKTRIGFNRVITEEWIGHLLETAPDAIIVHGRTQKMQSEGLASWEEIGKAVQLRNALQSQTLILGNGDVRSIPEAREKVRDYGVDGVMIGTGIFKNPWLFSGNDAPADRDQKLELLLRHLSLYHSTWGEEKSFNLMKRFFKIYLNGFNGAAVWRDQLMHARDYAEVLQTVDRLSHTDIIHEITAG